MVARVTRDEDDTKNVEVFPNDRGTARTVVRLVEQQPDRWVVFEARADEIQVDEPARNAPISPQATVVLPSAGSALEIMRTRGGWSTSRNWRLVCSCR